MERPDIAALRVEYEAVGIDPSDMAEDPVEEFSGWFGDAVATGVPQPNTFVLATATEKGVPSARAVLMKDYGPEGIVFFTNTNSRKGAELASNPRAAACFVWLGLHRQIRMEGGVEAVSPQMADEYFETRPPGSRLAAAASPQSDVVADRASLDDRYAALASEYPQGEVPRPEHWGGYRIVPDVYEFWQGRPHRFHDRVRYRQDGSRWVRARLAP